MQILSELGFNGVWGGLGTRVIMIGTLTGGYECGGVGSVLRRTRSILLTFSPRPSATMVDIAISCGACSSAAVKTGRVVD